MAMVNYVVVNVDLYEEIDKFDLIENIEVVHILIDIVDRVFDSNKNKLTLYQSIQMVPLMKLNSILIILYLLCDNLYRLHT